MVELVVVELVVVELVAVVVVAVVVVSVVVGATTEVEKLVDSTEPPTVGDEHPIRNAATVIEPRAPRTRTRGAYVDVMG